MNEFSPFITILDTDYKYIYHSTLSINQFYSNLAMNSYEYEEIVKFIREEKYLEAAQVHGRQKENTKKDPLFHRRKKANFSK